MKLNKISKIDETKGEYIILGDYRTEGIAVIHQTDDLEEAINKCLEPHDCPLSLVKLIDILSQED